MSASFDNPRRDPVLSMLLKNLGGAGVVWRCIGFDLFSLSLKGKDVLWAKQVSVGAFKGIARDTGPALT